MLPNYTVQGVMPGVVEVSGSFAVAGGALGAVVGSGFGVTDAGVGDFLITFTDRYAAFVSVVATIATAAGGLDVVIQTGIPVVIGNVATVHIFEWATAGGALADVNGTISFSAKLATRV